MEEEGGIATEEEVTTGLVLTSFARGIRSSSSSSSITIVVVAFFAVCPEEVEVFEAAAAVSLGCGENLRADIGFGEKEAAVGGADTAGVCSAMEAAIGVFTSSAMTGIAASTAGRTPSTAAADVVVVGVAGLTVDTPLLFPHKDNSVFV